MNTKTISLVGLILLAAVLRLLPHPWNFSPIAAMALLGGASLRTRSGALLVPLAALFLSDWVLGFYPTMFVTYAAFAAVVMIGRLLSDQAKAPKIFLASMAGSITFYVLSNFGVWLWDGLYPLNTQGLVACYTAALPFFQGTLAGDLFYAAVLFGAFRFAQARFPALQQASSI